MIKYGIYVNSKNPGWLMDTTEDLTSFTTQKEAKKWVSTWLVHTKYYEVRKITKTLKRKLSALKKKKPLTKKPK